MQNNTNNSAKTREETIAYYEAKIEALPSTLPKGKAATAQTRAATAAATGIVTAKKVSKAQRIRNNAAKAVKRAAASADKMTIPEAIVRAVDGTRQGEAACRILAFALERDFGKDWYIWDSGNMRSDNEKAIYAKLEEHRRNCQELALTKGLSNINKPWSDAKRVQKEKNLGGRPAERIKRPLDSRIHEAMRKAYKAGMKEDKMTDKECDIMDSLGKLLVAYFNEDLSKLG
jgi:hypothetical protein